MHVAHKLDGKAHIAYSGAISAAFAAAFAALVLKTKKKRHHTSFRYLLEARFSKQSRTDISTANLSSRNQIVTDGHGARSNSRLCGRIAGGVLVRNTVSE